MVNLDWEAVIVFVVITCIAYVLGAYVFNPEKENRHE